MTLKQIADKANATYWRMPCRETLQAFRMAVKAYEAATGKRYSVY